MTKAVIIIGARKLAELVYLDNEKYKQYKIENFCVSQKYYKNDTFCDKPVVIFEDLIANNNAQQYAYLLAIGYSNFKAKEKIFNCLKKHNLDTINHINPTAHIGQHATLGTNNIIFGHAYIDHNVLIGDSNIIRPNCYIGHDTTIENNNYVAPACKIAGYNTIGSNCFIGIGTTTIDRETIEDDCVIGASSLLTKDTEKGGLYYGSPAVKKGAKK